MYNYLLLLIIKINFLLLYFLENDKDCSLMNGCIILSDIFCVILEEILLKKKKVFVLNVFFFF